MKAPTTRDRPAPRRRALRRRWAPGGGCGACSCGLLAGGTQDVPLHIRPEVLATDGSACGALDCRAVLCRDSAACHPVRHRRWSNANGASKGAFRSENFSSFCERFHAHSLGSARAHAATFRLSSCSLLVRSACKAISDWPSCHPGCLRSPRNSPEMWLCPVWHLAAISDCDRPEAMRS